MQFSLILGGNACVLFWVMVMYCIGLKHHQCTSGIGNAQGVKSLLSFFLLAFCFTCSCRSRNSHWYTSEYLMYISSTYNNLLEKSKNYPTWLNVYACTKIVQWVNIVFLCRSSAAVKSHVHWCHSQHSHHPVDCAQDSLHSWDLHSVLWY